MKPIFKKCILRLLLFISYGLLGSLLFILIEKRAETYEDTANRLLEQLRKEMADKYSLTNSTEFHRFVSKASEASQLMSKLDWTFVNSCGFVFAAIATVGYGDICPQTPLGRAFTIPYCLIGLPLTMLALKTAGEVVVLGLKTLTVTFEKKVLGHRQPQQKLTKCFSILVTCIILLVCLIATAEMHIEGWTFLEGVYCWFVTFTTIGFGDYIPFQKYRVGREPWVTVVSGIIVTIPYITGLCLVSSLFSLLVESSDKIKVHLHKLQCCQSCCRIPPTTVKAKHCKLCHLNISRSEPDFSENQDRGIVLQTFNPRRCSV